MRRFERQMLRPVLEAIVSESVAAERQNDEAGLDALRAVMVFILWHEIAASHHIIVPRRDPFFH
jgi:hypothetical protein